ncbi:hypothetical protein Tco_1135797 [Tanacetum coccineum]
MRPFGCPVTILNTIDHLGKLDGKADEGSLLGTAINIVPGNQSKGMQVQKHVKMRVKLEMRQSFWQNYILLPLGNVDSPFSQSSKSSPNAGFKPSSDGERSTNNVNVASTNEVNVIGGKSSIETPDDPNMSALEDYIIFDLSSDDQRCCTSNKKNDKELEEHGLFSSVQQRTNHKDFQNCLFACFLSQEEPKKMDVKSAFLYGKIEEEVYCKKQTMVENSTTVAEYVAASSCCGQEKTVNGEVQLQALVDGKKIIVTEASVRRDLQLNDEEGTDCLPNATIFEQLALMGSKTTAWNGFSSTMASAIIYFSKGSVDPTLFIHKEGKELLLKQKPTKPKRKDTEVPQPSGLIDNVADEAIYEEMDDSLERDATTATSLDAEQDRGNTNKTQSKETLNEPSSLGTSLGSGPMRQETMGDTIAQTGFENVSKTSNDSLLTGVNTPQSDEDRLKLNELMEFCTKLQQRVGRSTRVISSDEASLGDQEDASKQGRKIDDIDKDAEITLVDELKGGHDMAKKEINVAEKEVSTADPVMTTGEVVTTASVEISTTSPIETIIADDLTLAQTLIEIRSAKPKVKGVMIGEQKMIDDDYQMAQQIQAEEQEKLSIEEKSKLYKHNQLKNKSFDDIQKLFDKAMKWVNTFVDMDTELVEGSEVRVEGSETRAEGSSKRAGEDLQ